MKNKIFNIFLFSLSVSALLFLGILVYALFQQLGYSTLQKPLNYKEIFFAARMTVVTATVSSGIAVLLAIPLAYVLSRYDFPLKSLVSSLLYLPLVVSPIALGSMLLIFFSTGAGRFIERNLFRIVFEVPGIIFAQFIVIVGLAISLIKSVFDYIDPEYEAVARTLGANKFQTFFHNLLPAAKKGIISAFLLVWARAVGEFGATVTLAGAMPMKTETLPVAIYLSFASADVGSAIALIFIAILLGISVLFLVHWLYAKNRESVI
jgi:molybdate transport system permease protein